MVNGGGVEAFTNAGTVLKSGGVATSAFGAAVTFTTNDGVINALTGTIQMPGLTTNNGLLTTSAGAALSPNAALDNTGTIAGNGSINANITNNAFATIAPGQSGGALTINGNLILLTDGDLNVELNGTTPGVGGHDQLIVTGATTLGGNLNASLGFAVSDGNTFDILTSAGATSATFDNVTLPTVDFALSGEGTNTLTVTFSGTCGADVCWTNGSADGLWTTDANWSTLAQPNG